MEGEALQNLANAYYFQRNFPRALECVRAAPDGGTGPAGQGSHRRRAGRHRDHPLLVCGVRNRARALSRGTGAPGGAARSDRRGHHADQHRQRALSARRLSGGDCRLPAQPRVVPRAGGHRRRSGRARRARSRLRRAGGLRRGARGVRRRAGGRPGAQQTRGPGRGAHEHWRRALPARQPRRGTVGVRGEPRPFRGGRRTRPVPVASGRIWHSSISRRGRVRAPPSAATVAARRRAPAAATTSVSQAPRSASALRRRRRRSSPRRSRRTAARSRRSPHSDRPEPAARAEIGLSQAETGLGRYKEALEAAGRARTSAVGGLAERHSVAGAGRRSEGARQERRRRERRSGRRARPSTPSTRCARPPAPSRAARCRATPRPPLRRWRALQAESGDATAAFDTSERMRVHDLRAALVANEREIARGMTAAERDEERVAAGAVVSRRAQLARERGAASPRSRHGSPISSAASPKRSRRGARNRSACSRACPASPPGAACSIRPAAASSLAALGPDGVLVDLVVDDDGLVVRGGLAGGRRVEDRGEGRADLAARPRRPGHADAAAGRPQGSRAVEEGIRAAGRGVSSRHARARRAGPAACW